MAIDTCVHIPELPEPQRLTLPGGVTLVDVDLFRVLQPALAPLMPLFQVVDAIVAVYQCVQATVDAITSLDAAKIASCIPELAEKMGKLLRLVPQLSLPFLIYDLLGICIGVLEETRGKLVHLQVELEQIALVAQRARELDDPRLLKIASCTEENINREAANTLAALAGLGSILGLVDVFLSMIGGPELPKLTGSAGQPFGAAIAPLDALVQALTAVRRTFPIPS